MCGDPEFGGAAMDIVVWLRSLGLEQYGAAFRENEITGNVLPRQTAEDLKALGVSIVGHRRLLLRRPAFGHQAYFRSAQRVASKDQAAVCPLNP